MVKENVLMIVLMIIFIIIPMNIKMVVIQIAHHTLILQLLMNLNVMMI